MSTHPKVLVVDDTPANLLVMRRLLSKIEIELVEVPSGQLAVSACLDHEFALILLDVNMPDMDGYEAAALIGESDKNQLTPIIFITAGYGDDTSKLKGYHAGAVDFMAKPINDHILRSKVQIFLELWNARHDLKNLTLRLHERNLELEREVAERKRMAAIALHRSHHDPLTNLPNRALFIDRLEMAVQRSERNARSFALLYVDIDHFKPVNDLHGHAIGDLLLQQIGQRLSDAVRATDTVARLGGDEFAIILEEVGDREQAMQVGQSICTKLSTPFSLARDGELLEVEIGGSVGVALYPHNGHAYDALLSAADDAMYQAKSLGKNRCAMASQQELGRSH